MTSWGRLDLAETEDSAAFQRDQEEAARRDADGRNNATYVRAGGRWRDADDVPDLADVVDPRGDR